MGTLPHSQSARSKTKRRIETGVALVICAGVMLGPLLYIQIRYDEFTGLHGQAKEGAAVTGVALAVVLRTISRTVLRTVIRTSARAGMRAALRTAVRTFIRSAVRSTSSNLFQWVGREDTRKVSDLQSLTYASVLIYISWVVVIGLGQPFADLSSTSDAILAQEAQSHQEFTELERQYHLRRDAYEAKLTRDTLYDNFAALQHQLKAERDLDAQALLAQQQDDTAQKLYEAEIALAIALKSSDDQMYGPEMNPPIENDQLALVQASVFTYAPFPGSTPTDSTVIWLGGLVMILPLWFIFASQRLWARREQVSIHHSTGFDGALIQLYFAGALSFMPLTSDTTSVDADVDQRGRIALVGILAPCLMGVILWKLGHRLNIPGLIFAADAFIIYPMVQIFPLRPLEGLFLWRHSRLIWTLIFIVVLSLFTFVGSQALQSVI